MASPGSRGKGFHFGPLLCATLTAGQGGSAKNTVSILLSTSRYADRPAKEAGLRGWQDSILLGFLYIQNGILLHS